MSWPQTDPPDTVAPGTSPNPVAWGKPVQESLSTTRALTVSAFDLEVLSDKDEAVIIDSPIQIQAFLGFEAEGVFPTFSEWISARGM